MQLVVEISKVHYFGAARWSFTYSKFILSIQCFMLFRKKPNLNLKYEVKRD